MKSSVMPAVSRNRSRKVSELYDRPDPSNSPIHRYSCGAVDTRNAKQEPKIMKMTQKREHGK